MNFRKRKKNEKAFGNWEEKDDGTRTYYFDIKGKMGWTARYIKEVDKYETTLRFLQEIYDERGKLVEIHEKYPVDKGHKKL